ncbi:hypothetical protein LZ31DRAFT_550410 [Colletotrichum somersetense]|nr:hypothetical protein LZ31DRAFT_550410 [Colletotrichum somersetense]
MEGCGLQGVCYHAEPPRLTEKAIWEFSVERAPSCAKNIPGRRMQYRCFRRCVVKCAVLLVPKIHRKAACRESQGCITSFPAPANKPAQIRMQSAQQGRLHESKTACIHQHSNEGGRASLPLQRLLVIIHFGAEQEGYVLALSHWFPQTPVLSDRLPSFLGLLMSYEICCLLRPEGREGREGVWLPPNLQLAILSLAVSSTPRSSKH